MVKDRSITRKTLCHAFILTSLYAPISHILLDCQEVSPKHKRQIVVYALAVDDFDISRERKGTYSLDIFLLLHTIKYESRVVSIVRMVYLASHFIFKFSLEMRLKRIQ